MLLILVVALVVIGPERLPKAARTMGLWVGRARSVFNSMRRDIEREARLDELRKAERDFRKDLDLGLKEDVTKDLDDDSARAGKAKAKPHKHSGAPAGRSIADDDAPEPDARADNRVEGEPEQRGRGDNGNT